MAERLDGLLGEATLDEATMKEWLMPLEDPEIRMGLVELGLIYECRISKGDESPPQDKAEDKGAVVYRVDVKMTLTSPGCPAADYMVQQVKDRVLEYPGVKDAHVELVFEPKWDPKIMASEECKEKMGIW